MKKLLLIIFFLLGLQVFSASISGTVTVENGSSLGVFVYVEGQNKYDITDSKGKFKIDNLSQGQEYTIVFQKGNYKDYKKKYKLIVENFDIKITIPDEKKSENKVEIVKKSTSTKKITTKKDDTVTKQTKKKDAVSKISVKGKINSVINNDVFLELDEENFGVIIEPNKDFIIQIEPGKYKGKIIQEGSFIKEVEINVSKTSTNIGTINLEPIDYNTLIIRTYESVENGTVQLYRDGFLEYSSKIPSESQEMLIKGIKKGEYTLVLKAFGKKTFEQKISLKGEVVVDVDFEKIITENKVVIEIEPNDLNVNLKLYLDQELKKESNGNGQILIEGLENDKIYSLILSSPKHKTIKISRVIAGDKVKVDMLREIKGTLISGFVSPFNSKAEVLLLKDNVIIGTTRTNTNGYYEIETDEKLLGEVTLRVVADGFEDELLQDSFNDSKVSYEKNITLTPYTTNLGGKVTFGDENQGLQGVYVLIKDLGIWQLTNGDGEFYFNSIPEGDYEVTFEKNGFITGKMNISTVKDEFKNSNIKMESIGKIIFRSNQNDYTIDVNGKIMNVGSRIYELIQGTGIINIKAYKKGYLPLVTKLNLTEAGEIRDVILDFVDETYQNKIVEDKISKIKNYIKDLKIVEAENVLVELREIKNIKAYEADYKDIEGRLRSAKMRLFSIDRSIKFEIEKVKLNIEKAESSKDGYLEKNKELNKIYKESIEYLEKIIESHPYTTYRYDINMIESEIYVKLGMPNSSKKSIAEAKKYEGRRKE
ncbi:MAG: carboxypeptidase-like regulatory domain-containing protein [Fusobacteriaceae bacterium]|nr:carboxypeptidase-like regulatory domain-containing protein [Fusobacteriaceae bacterium]